MTKHIFTAMSLSLMAAPAFSDTITGDLTVRDHLCVGASCANGGVETFGNEGLKIKSITPWISFEDTSTANPFGNDWLFRVNSADASFFAFEDTDGATQPFRVDAGARTDALRVASSGNIGIGTGLPQRDLHMRGGDSPTIRLEQDGAGGNPTQTWEIGGNEVGFFIFDTTASTSPFFIAPGAGNDRAFSVESNGDIGLGTLDPEAKLHVAGTSMLIKNNGRVNFTLSDTSDPGPDFRTQLTAGTARFSFVGTGAPEMELFQTGDLAIRGNYISAGTQLTVPDYVFDEDYALRPLAEVQSFIDTHSHLPDVPSAADIAAEGLDMTEMQMTLLKKIEELTLYTLKQEAEMAALRRRLDALDGQ
ncbi:MAG: hypothetical protein AAF943_18625 [Pseudomonadota bacterium]